MLSFEKNKILNPSWIGKTQNENVDYLMYYPSSQQMKILQLQVYIQSNDFMRNKKLNLVWQEMTLSMHLSAGGYG